MCSILHVRFDEGAVATPVFYSVKEIGANNKGSLLRGILNKLDLCSPGLRFRRFFRPPGVELLRGNRLMGMNGKEFAK